MPCLILLEMPVLDALSVPGNAFDGNDALTLRQEVGCGREIREEKKRDNSHQCAGRPKDQENVHPTRQACGDVADSVADQSAKHCCNAVRAVV